MVDLLPAADNPHICSGKTLVSGLRAVPLPSSGHTPLAVRLTVGDPHLLERGKPRLDLPSRADQRMRVRRVGVPEDVGPRPTRRTARER